MYQSDLAKRSGKAAAVFNVHNMYKCPSGVLLGNVTLIEAVLNVSEPYDFLIESVLF